MASEVVLGTGDVAEFQTPNWTPQFEPWYTPGSPERDDSPVDHAAVPLLGLTPAREEQSSVDVLQNLVLSHSKPPAPFASLSVDLSAIPTYDVSVDVLSPFVSPTPTAAAVCVIAGVYRKGSLGNLDSDDSSSGSGHDRQRHQDEVVSWDVIIGEALPVVRLRHIAAMPHEVVCIVDVRNCTPVEHSVFMSNVKRLAPSLRILHCPVSLLRAPARTGVTPQKLPLDIELVLSDRELSARLDGSLTEAFKYTATGGLDVDMMNAAVGMPGGDSLCQLAIASSMQHRTYQRFTDMRSSFMECLLSSPQGAQLAALKGCCMALFAESDTAGMVFARDFLVRAGFPGVCGLSQTFLVASRLADT